MFQELLPGHTRVLINVWLEYTILHNFAQISSNMHLYLDISWKLEEAGLHQTLSSCLKHMKQLRLPYQRAKDTNNCSRRGLRTCSCYHELDWVSSKAANTYPEVTHDHHPGWPHQTIRHQ